MPLVKTGRERESRIQQCRVDREDRQRENERGGKRFTLDNRVLLYHFLGFVITFTLADIG